MKLAFVVQRYGSDIAGGSEAHCRELAERLMSRHDITVLTTCARDYVTWKNELPAGESQERHVRVIRFPVDRTRRLDRFAELTEQVTEGADSTVEEAWFRENGPLVPGLLRHLQERASAYDLVLFWTFRYYPSFFGLPLVADRAILIPTAEDDPIIRLKVLEEFFGKPAGFLFMTPEEEQLVSARAARTLAPAATVGMGIAPAVSQPDARALLDSHQVPAEYVLYLGRIDRNKGCESLLEYFQQFAAGPAGLSLVLAGPAKIQVPAHPRIRTLGYVADDLRQALLKGAVALVVPSPYESLSIVVLEAWNEGVPVVVNAYCDVLDGQVRRANGGFSYRGPGEFAESLSYLQTHPAERLALGANGRDYVNREYRWPTVIARVEQLLATVLTSRSATA